MGDALDKGISFVLLFRTVFLLCKLTFDVVYDNIFRLVLSVFKFRSENDNKLLVHICKYMHFAVFYRKNVVRNEGTAK